MKGLTPEELGKVMSFAQKHHKFGYVPEEDRINSQIGHWIKYIDVCWDTRTCEFWCIVFRQGMMGICFRTNHWALSGPPKGWKYNNLYDLCMAYLKYEFTPKDEFFIDTDEDCDKQKPIKQALILDSDDEDQIWFVRDVITGKKTNFASGDAAKLKAYEYLYQNQRFYY